MAQATFKETRGAFEQAIKEGRLSYRKDSPIYAGNYMYMGTWDGKDHFKNIDTRQYDV